MPLASGRVVIIGAGVVGLATARLLARRGFEVFILEAGPRIAEGVSSRNSGVIHSPINYAQGSLKARLCARGREMLYDWCEKAGVPYRQLGKLIVASTSEQTTELTKLHGVAIANGAVEVKLISGEEIQALEPAVTGNCALYAPRTGIVDPYELARSFLIDAEENGATLITKAEVKAVDTKKIGFEIHTSIGPIETDWVINSAGLYADEIAQMGCAGTYKIHPWRGDYFILQPGPSRKFEKLIYPVKDKSDPGLGVHLTIDLQGRYRLGPDVEYVTSKNDFTPREDKKDKFLAAAQRLFPWVTASMLHYDTCGIRPKLRAQTDTGERDFVISQDRPNWINLIGIESPGLTSSMAIAEMATSFVL